MLDDGSLLTLVGKQIKINRGGPEAKSGRLLAIKPDYLVLFTEGEGVIYYQTQHIKSITIQGNQENNEGIEQQNVEAQETPSFVDADDFVTLMQSFINSWVQINRGGPEKFEGILIEANSDFLKVSANNELTIIMTYHVKSISLAVPKPQPKIDSKPEGAQSNNTNAQTRGNARRLARIRARRVGIGARRSIKRPPKR